MENINQYINSIIRISYDNLPVEDAWTDFTVEAFCLTKFVQIHADYTDLNGKSVSFNPKKSGAERDEDLTFLFMDLRKAMYDINPGQGAWYSSKIIVTNDVKFKTTFDYDHKPPFAYEPSKDKFAHDLNTYPRTVVPVWLTDIINS